MFKKYTIITLLTALALNSCVQIDEPGITDPMEVKLYGSLLSTANATKAGGAYDSTTEETLTIGVVRIDQGAPGYPTFNQSEGQVKAQMEKGKEKTNLRKITFLDSYQQYIDKDKDIKYAAWFPYDKDSFNPDTKVITTPIDGNTDVMFGNIITGNYQTKFEPITFQHALSKFTFHIYAMIQEEDTQEDVDRTWGAVTDISILGLPAECALKLPVNQKDAEVITVEYKGTNAETHVPKLQGEKVLATNIPIGGNNALMLNPLLAAPPADKKLKVVVKTAKSVSEGTTKTMTIARDFQKGKNYDIYLRFSDHGIINAEVAVSDWMSGKKVDNNSLNNTIYYDLSAAEKANCYIVTSANYSYCFDVTTMGIGASGAVNGQSTTLNTGYLDILWMDKALEGYFTLESHQPIQNRVLFNVKNDESLADEKDTDNKELSSFGNVLIGAYDKDPKEEGRLLWTWHVWLTKRPSDQGYKNGFVVLDRDLGATEAHIAGNSGYQAMDGLYYQWGRPTPLPLNRDVTEFIVKTAGSGNDPDPDMLTRIAHPELFYEKTSGIDKASFIQSWGYNGSKHEFTKTVYDPCPPGYRVPSRSMFDHINFTEFKLNKEHGHSYDAKVDQYYDMSHPLAGFYSSVGKLNGYYATANNIATSNDNGAYLWSASVGGPDEDEPYSLDCLLQNDLSSSASTPTRPAHHALPVRCVSKRSIPETRNLSAYQTANCYIVDKTGYYKFKANVRGNGVNELISPGNPSSIDITEQCPPDISDKAYQVVPLWWMGDLSTDDKDNNGIPDGNDVAVTPVPIRLLAPDRSSQPGMLDEEGYVYFEYTAEIKGNLILAVKDQPGNILWTWHLWLTDTPKIHPSNDYAVMDRFLGATYCPETPLNSSMSEKQFLASCGFYYQWGRKDPFPGTAALVKSRNVSECSRWWKFEDSQWKPKNQYDPITKNDNEKTVKHSVSHPTVFHSSYDNFGEIKRYEPWSYNDNQSSYDLPDWYDNNNNRTFSNVKEISSLWGYSSLHGDLGKATSKTMYDPCPPGYSVAYYLIWQSADDITKPILIYQNIGMVDAEYKGLVKGSTYGMTITHTDFGETWYPFTGYVNCYDGTLLNIGQEGRFHSSTPKERTCRTFCYYRNRYGTVITGQGMGNGNRGLPTSYGFPVRCQKD